MEYLTYTEHYIDEDENYFLLNVGESSSSDKQCLNKEHTKCIDSAVSKSVNCEEISNSGFVETTDDNAFCSNVMASQAGLHKCCTNADVSDVYLDFNKGSKETIDNGKNTKVYSSSDFKKVELLSENLSEMTNNFKKCKESCRKFLKGYPSWSDKRKKVIAQLEEISEDLSKIKLDSNIAKLVGSSVGVAGGILSVAGAALIPFTMGVSTPLMIGGLVTSGLGGVTSLGTAVTEMCLLKQKIEAAQKILKEDKEEFSAMAELFEHAGTYVSALEDFLGFNPVAKVGSVPELCSLSTSELKLMTSPYSVSHTSAEPFVFEAPGVRKEVLNVVKMALPKTLHDITVPMSIIIAIAANPKLGELYLEVKRLHHDNPVIYEIIAMIYRIKIFKLADMQANFVTCVNTGAKLGGIAASATVGKALSRTLFAGLMLAIDVMSLTLTSIDVHNGSHCQSAEIVRKVNDQLSSEFDIMKSVYLELHECEVKKDV